MEMPILLWQQKLHLLREDSEVLPGQLRVSQVCPWVILRASYLWDILNRCPNYLSLLLSMQRSSGSTPNSSWATELLTLSLRHSPATLNKKLISATCTLHCCSVRGHKQKQLPLTELGYRAHSLCGGGGEPDCLYFGTTNLSDINTQVFFLFLFSMVS